jgi:hypothetical protein
VRDETYRRHPDRIINLDESGIQLLELMPRKVLAVKGTKRVVTASADCAKHSFTVIAAGTATGQVLPPNYLIGGASNLNANLLGNVYSYSQSAVCVRQRNHMMDTPTFGQYLEILAQQVPGGVSPERRALLVLDNHVSHVAAATMERARSLGFDILPLPPQTTPFAQPWDQVFKAVKEHLKKLVATSSHISNCTNDKYKPSLTQLIALVDSAFKLSVGRDTTALSNAFEKTGLWPASCDALLTAAEGVTASSPSARSPRRSPPHSPASPTEIQAIVKRAREPEVPCVMPGGVFHTKAAIEVFLRNVGSNGPKPAGRKPRHY